MQRICKGDGTADLFEEFMEEFVDAADFLDYFKAIWYPRLGEFLLFSKTVSVGTNRIVIAIRLKYTSETGFLLTQLTHG